MKGYFWWKDNLKLLGKYKDMVIVSVEKGDTFFLWQDNWNSLVPMTAFPELFSFSTSRNITLQKAKC
jgi:hypothetical protein